MDFNFIEITFDTKPIRVNAGTVEKIKEQLKVTQKQQVCCMAAGKFLQDNENLNQYQGPYIFLTASFAATTKQTIDSLFAQYQEQTLTVDKLKKTLSEQQTKGQPIQQYHKFPMSQSGPSQIVSNQEKDLLIESMEQEIQQQKEQLNNEKSEIRKLKEENTKIHLELKKQVLGQNATNIEGNQYTTKLKIMEDSKQLLQGQLNDCNEEKSQLMQKISEQKTEILNLKASQGSPSASNSVFDQMRTENVALNKDVMDLTQKNQQLQKINEKIKRDLQEQLEKMKITGLNQSSNEQLNSIMAQLEVQRKNNGDLNEVISKYKKQEIDNQKEDRIKEQSILSFRTLANNKQMKIDQLEFKIKGLLEDLQYQKNEIDNLLDQMKKQEQQLLSKIDQIKQESNQVFDSINQEKLEQQKQINKLTTQVDTLNKTIQDLKVQLQKQEQSGKKEEAEQTKIKIQEKVKDQEVFVDLQKQQKSQQEKREENLRKLQKIKEIQVKENADDQRRKIEEEQQNRERKRKQEQEDTLRIQEEKNRQHQEDMARKMQMQREADWRNKADRNILAQKLAKMSKESHGIIEICFLVDSTGSMETYIEQARQCVNGTMESIKRLTNRDCKWACVAYQDFDELRELKGKYRQVDFTTNPSDLQNFMNPKNLQCTGGGDCAEDVKGGMEQAFKLSWKMPFKIIILITDAPSHGRKYHQGCVDDHTHVMLDETLLKFKQTNTFLIGLQLNKITGYMFQVFSDFFKSNEAEEFFMTEDLTKTKTEQIWTNIVKLISTAAENATQTNQSGTKTKNRKLNANAGKGGAMEALCKNLSDPINFDKQPGIQLTENTFEIYNVSLRKENFEQKLDRVWEIDVEKDFLEQKESNSWNCIRTTKIFAEGQMKAVYLMKKKSLAKEVYVIKQPLGGMTYTTLKDAKMECRSHMISKAFLSAFIDELTQAKQEKGSPLVIPNVQYSNFLILQDKPNSFWIAERFYEGEFVKYNNNYGWISEENNDQNQLAQAYSYYTYFSSNFTAVVNDIQGVGQFWTDPALNTTNEHLDETDMGKDGIAMFMVTYQQKSNQGKKYLDLLGLKIETQV